MKFWSKIATLFLMAACLGVGQTTSPSSSAPSVSGEASPNSACQGIPEWFCVTQTLQKLIFNPDGTHRPDAAIATDASRAIAGLIKDGIMKPQNAPATPLSGFDDVNRYVEKYPGGDPAPAPAPPVSQASVKAVDAPTSVEHAASNGSAPSAVPASGPAKEAPKTGSPVTLAPPAGGSATSAMREAPLYVLGANDVVGVTVFEERNVTGTYAIGPDGRISMPLIGTFRVIGLTIPELTNLVAQKLRDDGGILEPVVNVQLLRSNSKQYTLIGALGRQGPVPLLRDTTVLDAIAGAGGFKEFAKRKAVKIMRGTKTYNFNYDDVLKGKNPAQNILLEDGDLIIVNE